MSLRGLSIIELQRGEVILTDVDFYDTYSVYYRNNWENLDYLSNEDIGTSDNDYSPIGIIVSVKTELD